MTVAALLLILGAAVAHASWNLLSKQASLAGGAAFVWLVAMVSCVVYLPVMVITVVITRPRFGWLELAMCAGTAVLHAGYFVLLQRAYRYGDLSLIYPLARGSGPLIVAVAGIAIFGERLGVWGYIGIGLMCAGVFGISLAGGGAALRPSVKAVGFGLATGLSISLYTLWDKWAVTALALSPIIYEWGSMLGRVTLLTPVALRQRAELRTLWAEYRLQVLGTAVLGPLAYIMILFAMRFTPVSAVAPAREVSVLIGVALGGRLLAEGHIRTRLLAAGAVAGGLIAIALPT